LEKLYRRFGSTVSENVKRKLKQANRRQCQFRVISDIYSRNSGSREIRYTAILVAD